MKALPYLVLSAILTLAAVRALWKLTDILKLKRMNFRREFIPAGFGFVLFLVLVPVYIGMLIRGYGGEQITVFLPAVLVFGILGMADDLYGDRKAGGFKGHIGLLLKGKISTGLAKAVGGGIGALILGFAAAGWGDPFAGVLNGLLVALSANFLNLLDLRPARALVLEYWGVVLWFDACVGFWCFRLCCGYGVCRGNQ